MAYTTIDDPSAHFQAKVYTGTNSNQSITNDGNSDLQPDLIIASFRTAPAYTNNRALIDSSRGRSKILKPNSDSGEDTTTNAAYDLVSFDTDGFTVGAVNSTSSLNASGTSNVAWQWKINGGTTSSNTSGNVTNTLQVNTTAGISISTFTSASSGNTTFGHGLGVTPAMFISKYRHDYGWWVNHKGLANQSDQYLGLHTTGDDATVSWGAAPTSTLITLAPAFAGNNLSMVCYAFAEIKGYSKFGKYMGNGNANGTFIYTGFKPAFFMCKRFDNTGNWLIFDNKRGEFNLNDNYIYLNDNSSEGTSSSSGVDFLSNGIKMRNTYNDANAAGYSAKYIYMAFAENPFVTSTGISTTAR